MQKSLLIILSMLFMSFNSMAQMTGNDRDAYGCIGSAGMTWSKLLKNCVQLWTVGDGLLPLPGHGIPGFATYVVYSKDMKQVEIFMPDANGRSMIFKRLPGKGKKVTWKFGSYKFTLDGYSCSLYVNNKEIYNGAYNPDRK